MRILFLSVLAALLLPGCTTTYFIKVRTFPPTGSAELLIDGRRETETSETGQARLTEARSIFAEPKLELRHGDRRGILILRYAIESLAVENVAMALIRKVRNDRYVDVVFSMVEIPLPLPQTFLTEGRNTFSVRNPNTVAVWVACRNGTAGLNLIVFEDVTEAVLMPDGDYEIYLLYSDEPDKLVVMREHVHLDGHGGSLELPLREERDTLTNPVGDPHEIRGNP